MDFSTGAAGTGMRIAMDAEVRELKKQRRKELRAVMKGISTADLAAAGAAATRLLLEQEHWNNCKSVLLYIPLGDELDLLACADAARESGKLLALPRYLPDQAIYCAAMHQGEISELSKGPFGVPEPPLNAPVVPLNRLDLVLVPGIGFDLAGRRLGRGKGFYDRLLAEVTGIKCGVALDEQVVSGLPEEPHDVPMNFVLTPTRWLPVRPNKT